MIKVETFQTDSNSDYELEKKINSRVGSGRVISIEQTDGYEWKIIYEEPTTNHER